MVAVVATSVGAVLSPASVDVRPSPSAGTPANAQPEQRPQAPLAEKASRQPTEQDVQKAVEQANRELAGMNRTIGFGYEERLGQIYVQVRDARTGEVVKEIPPKEFIEHQVAMREMLGLLLDRKA